MKLLHVEAGITGPASISRQLSAALVRALTRANPKVAVTTRDLDAEPLPHLSGGELANLGENPALQEFLGADIIVIGAPMYNFGIPSHLKAWFDPSSWRTRPSDTPRPARRAWLAARP